MQARPRAARGCAGSHACVFPSPWAAPASCLPSPRRWPVPFHRADKFMEAAPQHPHPPYTRIPAAPRTALLFWAHSGPTPQLPEAWRWGATVCLQAVTGSFHFSQHPSGPGVAPHHLLHRGPNSNLLSAAGKSSRNEPSPQGLPQGPASGGGEVIRPPVA